jgi:hypothetical protein
MLEIIEVGGETLFALGQIVDFGLIDELCSFLRRRSFWL